MAKRSPNKESNETKPKRQNPGMEFMDELEDIKSNILECMLYIAEQFKCKARIDYDAELRNDEEEFRQLDTNAKIDSYIPKAYREMKNSHMYERLYFTMAYFIIEEWKIQKYDDNVVKQYLNLTKKAVAYMDDADIRFGTNRINKFGNNKDVKGPNGDWLFFNDGNSQNQPRSEEKPYGNDSWVGYWGDDGYHWFKVFFSIALAMYVCSDGIKKVWKESTEGVEEVSSDLIAIVKGEATELINKMGIKEPAESFFSDAEMFMCLLLTAFCIKDDMGDKEKERIIKALIDHVKGEGTVIYKYRVNLLKDVAKKNELLATADTIISDYYVLPTLNRIDLENGRIKCKLEAGIGFGKTTFYRAIVTLMLRNHIIDERITAEKENLDELEKRIKKSWADIEFKNYFPIYVNTLSIYDDAQVNDLMQLAVGYNEYADLIKQYAKSDNGRQVMLIIDGLDEVNDNKQRIKLSKMIDSFIEKYENVNYIVSTRPIDLSAYKNENKAGAFLNGIQKVTIDKLSPEQKKAIIDKWVSVSVFSEIDMREYSKRIKATIEKSTYYTELSCNPFLLAKTVQLLVTEKPPKQYEIISSIVDFLITKKLHSNLQNERGITDKDIRRILSCLAYNCIIAEEGSFDWANLRRLYKTSYKSVSEEGIVLTQDNEKIWENSLKEINTKAGLIVYDEETKKYHWQSETLELFLAAEWALLEFQYLIKNKGESDANAHIKEKLDELRKHIRWEDIFIMMLVEWDENNHEYRRDYFRSAIRIIIRYLLDLTITLDTELIESIGRIILICCLETYANCYDDIVYEDDNEKESILLMLRFINQNAKIIDADGERVKECNTEHLDEYNELCEKGLIQFLQPV